MPKKDDFFLSVYEVVRLVPNGKVTTYGMIGSYLGAARSARMVGWAMNNAHNQSPKVPAHRVLNRNGQLTGKAHFDNPNKMQHLLEKEGVIIKNDQVVNLKEHLWDPSVELAL